MPKNRAVQVVFSNELELYSFRSIQIQISPQNGEILVQWYAKVQFSRTGIADFLPPVASR